MSKLTYRRRKKNKKDPVLEDKTKQPVTRSELAEVVEKLGSLRARVLIVDRRDGRVWGQEHQRRLKAA